MREGENPVFFHACVATADMARSVRFYTEVLGFEHYRTVGSETKIAGLTDRPERQPVQFLTRGGFMIELTANGVDPTARVLAEGNGSAPGLHHLSFLVDDLDAAIERIRAFGGAGDGAGKLATPDGPMVFCTDPDGVKLELWERRDFPPPDQPR